PLLFASWPRPPPCSPLFPYTTLFRSRRLPAPQPRVLPPGRARAQPRHARPPARGVLPPTGRVLRLPGGRGARRPRTRLRRLLERSEEHTSELQSLTNLVCRLLLEQKN